MGYIPHISSLLSQTLQLDIHRPGTLPLQWHHNDRDGVSHHWRLDYLLKRLFRHRSRKTSNLRVTGFLGGNPPVTSGFPLQRASNAKVFLFDDVIMFWSVEWLSNLRAIRKRCTLISRDTKYVALPYSMDAISTVYKFWVILNSTYHCLIIRDLFIESFTIPHPQWVHLIPFGCPRMRTHHHRNGSF